MAVVSVDVDGPTARGLEEDRSGLVGEPFPCSTRPSLSDCVGVGWRFWLYGRLYDSPLLTI
jgi:hypothetical protein